MTMSARLNARAPASKTARSEPRALEVARQHRPCVGRAHTFPILRALSKAEGGRLHYSALDVALVGELGKRVSSLNVILHDLAEEGFVLELPKKQGYEITDRGRKALAMEPFAVKHGSSGNGGEGVGA